MHTSGLDFSPIHLFMLSVPAVSLFFALSFVILSRLWRQSTYLLPLAFAFFLFALAVLSQWLRSAFYGGTNAMLSGLLYTVAILLFADSALRRSNLRFPKLLGLSLLVFVIAGTAWFNYLHPSLRGRILCINFAFFATFGFLGTQFLLKAERSLLDKILAWLSLAIAADILSRILFTTATVNHLSSRAAYLHSAFWIWQNLSALVLIVMLGVTLVLAISTDVAEQFRHQAKLDSLTGLLNRRGFEEIAEPILQAPRFRPISVILVDIDHFKAINDTFGHAAGDAILIAIADLLRRHMRQSNAVARIGGEEFILLLPGTAQQNAYTLADRLRLELAEQHFGSLHSGLQKITASFGVAEHTPHQTLHDIMSIADRMLYEAKRSGRNCVVASHALSLSS
jgi:diguanylate cyclase (GGDEF)-like protein